MKKVSLCLLLDKAHYQTIYCFERIGFALVEKEKEFVKKDEPKEYINTIYGVEVEFIVGYTNHTDQQTTEYFKKITNNITDVGGLSKYEALNKLFAKCNNDFVCVYGFDCIVQKNWLLELVFYAGAVNNSGIVSICDQIKDITCCTLLGNDQDDFFNTYIQQGGILTNESIYLFNKQNLYLIGGFDTETDLYGYEYKQLQLRYTYTYHNNFYIPTQSTLCFNNGAQLEEYRLPISEQNLKERIDFMKKTQSFYVPLKIN